MNREIVINAIKISRESYKYEQKIYGLINVLTVYAGETAYVEEMGSIQGLAEDIIKKEFSLDKINELDADRIMEDVVILIRESEEDIIKTFNNVKDLIERNTRNI